MAGLLPVPAALTQEVIDVAVILNALRALGPGRPLSHVAMPAAAARSLAEEHAHLENGPRPAARHRRRARRCLGAGAERLIAEANGIVSSKIVSHERDDESSVYPRLARYLADSHGLAAMSRAHREILHLARLLARMSEELPIVEVDRYLIRDAQRVIEAIETLVRIHNAQEEDIYEHAAA